MTDEPINGRIDLIACKASIDSGYGGYVYFDSKTDLIKHYKEEIGAFQVGSSCRMFIDEVAAKKISKEVFPKMAREELTLDEIGVATIPRNENTIDYDIRKIVKYCKANNKKPDELTEAELKDFIVEKN